MQIEEHQYTNGGYPYGVTILELAGELTLGEANEKLQGKLDTLLTRHWQKNIVLDMAKITHIDSAGLGGLLWSRTVLSRQGASLKLLHLEACNAHSSVITKLLSAFDCEAYQSERDAVRSFDRHNY